MAGENIESFDTTPLIKNDNGENISGFDISFSQNPNEEELKMKIKFESAYIQLIEGIKGEKEGIISGTRLKIEKLNNEITNKNSNIKYDPNEEIIGLKDGLYYITTISEFEKNLGNINKNNYNEKELYSYFKYLYDKINNNTNNPEDINKVIELGKKLDSIKDNLIIKQLLIKSGLKNVIDINNGNYENIFTLPEKDFGNIIKFLPENKLPEIYNYLEKNDNKRKNFLEIQRKVYFNNICPGGKIHNILLNEITKIDNLKEIKSLKEVFLKKLEVRLNGEKELANKLYSNLEKSINEQLCFFNILDVFTKFNKNEINNFNDKNPNNKIKIFELNEIKGNIKSLNIINKKQLLINENDIENEINNIENDNELTNEQKEEKIKKLLDKKDFIKYKKIKFERIGIITEGINEKDFILITKLIEEGKSSIEINETLRKTNPEIDKRLKEFEKENGEFLKKYEEKNFNNLKNEKLYSSKKNEKVGKIQNFEHEERTKKPIIYKSKNGVIYKSEFKDGIYKITTGNKSKIKKPDLIINEKEYTTIQSNPKTMENFTKLHDFFNDLRLNSIWKYRDNIITTMRNSGLNINYEDNGLTKGEFINFGNKLIKIINKISGTNIKENNTNIKSIKQELGSYSGTKISGGNIEYGVLGKDRFEYELTRNGIIIGGIFQNNKFEKLLKTK